MDGGAGPKISVGSTISQRKWILPEMLPLFVRDIDNQLHAAHFGIVDISDLNANVFVETGFLIGLGKPVNLWFLLK